MDLFQLSSLKTLFDPPTNNLTSELESLQFEKLCPGGYNDLLIQLRRRSNLLTTTHIAHACYFVALANRIKREGDKLKGTPDKKRSNRLMAEVRREPGLKIGIIGVGRIGYMLATHLLRHGDVYPDELWLSSRQADLLTDMIQNGVAFCKLNNIRLVEQCHIVFLCVAPHHLRYVIDDIRDRIKSHVLIYSLVLGFPARKLASLLHHTRIIKPSYQWIEANINNNDLWPMADDIESILLNETLLKRISLENENFNDNLIYDKEFIPMMIYVLLNILKQYASLDQMESLKVLSALLFDDINIRFNVEMIGEIEINDDNKKYFQDFDLIHCINKLHYFRQFFDENATIRYLFSQTFISHFIQFK